MRRGGGGLFARPGKLFTADQSLKAEGLGKLTQRSREKVAQPGIALITGGR